MIRYFKNLFLLFSISLLLTCNISKKTTVPRNLERIYNPSSSTIHPKIRVYNFSDSNSIIIEKLYTNELLYNHANAENKLIARIKIKYNLYDLDQRQKLTDSLTTTFLFEKNKEVAYHVLEIPMNAKIGYDYFLEIITIDQNRKNTNYSFKRLDRTKNTNSQDFMIYNKNNNEIFVNPFIKEGIPFGIKYREKDIDSLKVYFFFNNSEIPLAPYLSDTIGEELMNSDTSWICYTDSIDYSNFSREGVYYFTSEFNSEKKPFSQMSGFALNNFGDDFPIIQTPKDLIKPLAYLGLNDTISEMDTIGKHTKLAVDNFWLARANNKDRSRELLKLFYQRVLYTNMYFTSYKEGWQTDRGMVYIIYGLPDYLFKSGLEEKWIYSPTDLGTGIGFTFHYQESTFSSNHYILEREKLKTTGWDEAVKIWNNGEVFYYQN